MIIVQLNGGLGNQLFQYAAGRRLAIHHHVPLKLDLRSYEQAQAVVRTYRLSQFAISAAAADNHEIWRLRGDESRIGRAYRWGQARLPIRQRRYVREPHFHVEPAILELGSTAYLEGYWQSERYFADISATLREDLTLPPPSGRNRELAEAIKSSTAVSVHVRRTDYLNPRNLAIHGVCSLDYYRAAIDLLEAKVPQAQFYIFADDPNWARANLMNGPRMQIVDHNGPEHDYEDLRLMSYCRHHIIANSSFSWWGAWLNPAPQKLVVAPARWFITAERDTRDLLPPTWLRLPN